MPKRQKVILRAKMAERKLTSRGQKGLTVNKKVKMAIQSTQTNIVGQNGRNKQTKSGTVGQNG
jgi:hypothetical protein